ncbi:MAG: EAL domain-containing protein [Gammaproteobacteria bacterium]|nr:EAL domain-containing protein [Gammaproteobacteria bacterium]
MFKTIIKGIRHRLGYSEARTKVQGKPVENKLIAASIIAEKLEKRDRDHDFLLKQCQLIADYIDEMIMITDRKGGIVYVNPSFERFTGYSNAELFNRSANVLESGAHDERFYAKMWEVILKGKIYRDTFINRNRAGRIYYENKLIRPLIDDQGKIAGFLSIGSYLGDELAPRDHDIESMEQGENPESYERIFLLDRLSHAISRAAWSHRSVAVVHVDLDNFKLINDAFGFKIGDRVIESVKQRLTYAMRKDDTVAAPYGDEIVIVLQDVSNASQMSTIVTKIKTLFARPFIIEAQEIFLTASAGISIFPQDGDTPDTLLNHAMSALGKAKERGKNSYVSYAKKHHEQAVKRLVLETELHHALERREFFIEYQPLLDLNTGLIQGGEALLRWKHPQLGVILPASFIPLLEKSGLIAQVTQWGMLEACIQARKWRSLHKELDLSLSYNISACQFESPNLCKSVLRVINDSGIVPHALHLELTETTLLREADKSIRTLKNISALGIEFVIDDFGAGFSSFAYLKRFKADKLKIDKSFVDEIDVNGRDKAIMESMVAMAHTLGLSVVAEGVESAAQFKELKRCQCDQIQGYVLSRPLSAKAFERLLANHDPQGFISKMERDQRIRLS